MLGSCTEYKGTSRLHELLFCVGQDSPLKLPYGHIARKGTSPLHELLFCVGQDSPLRLPYGPIARKSTSPLHEVLFCVRQDFGHKVVRAVAPGSGRRRGPAHGAPHLPSVGL